MRVWTDGSVHVVVGEAGVEVHRPKQAPAVHPLGGKRPKGYPPRDVLVVLAGDPLRVWAGAGKAVRKLALGAEVRSEGTVEAHVLDAIGIGGESVLACVADAAKERARLVVAEGGDLAGARELGLPPATKIEWPGGIWQKADVPWPEDDVDEDEDPPALDALAVALPQRDGEVFFNEVICAASEHGFTVTGAYAGLVAAVAPDGGRVDFVLRVPTQVGETEIFAARTAQGVVVVLSVEGRQGAILHLAPDGKVIGHRHVFGKDQAWGLGPPVVQGDRVVVYEMGQHGEHRLHDLKLPDLAVAKTLDAGGEASGRVSVWGAPGATSFVLGLGSRAAIVKRDGRGRLTPALLDKVTPPEPPRAAVPSGPRLADGAPSLSLGRVERAVPWDLGVGDVFTIEIPFTNQGGPSRGVAVELGGAAMQAGLVRAVKVKINDAEVPLETKGAVARAELPEMMIPAGFALPSGTSKAPTLPPPPPLVHKARVDIHGAKGGTAILTVRIAPLKAAPGRGSVLQGKSVTVRG